MKIENLQCQNRLRYFSHPVQFMCDVDFKDDGTIVVSKRVVPETLDMHPEDLAGEAPDICVYDDQSFKPISESSGSMAWNLTEVPKGEYFDGPAIRYTFTRNDDTPRHIGEHTDYPLEQYARRTEYDILSLAIDRLPNGAQKTTLRHNFDKAAAAMGYEPIGAPGVKRGRA